MAILDFIKNRNASQQQPVAQTTQPQPAPQPTVESLPAHVKAQAVEAARPAAELMEKATTPRTATGRCAVAPVGPAPAVAPDPRTQDSRPGTAAHVGRRSRAILWVAGTGVSGGGAVA